MLSRRIFVGWLSGVGAALGFGVRSPRVEAIESGEPEQGNSLDGSMIRSLAEVVLPAELGNDGFVRVSRAFTQWVAAYRPGLELVHPYGSSQIRQTGASPAPRWKSQLTALDRESREKHKKGFAGLTREQRRELVMATLAADRANRLPDPVEANHVAMALMAWYFASPDASDLCYNARIGRNQCRPLVNAPREPLPLAGSGRARTS